MYLIYLDLCLTDINHDLYNFIQLLLNLFTKCGKTKVNKNPKYLVMMANYQTTQTQ